MVTIKDMKMPKNCGECDCSYWHDYCGTYFCSLTGNNVLENQKDMDCPLVEIGACKDCKWWYKGNKYSYCTKRLNVDSAIDRYREPNFYCADFERKA